MAMKDSIMSNFLNLKNFDKSFDDLSSLSQLREEAFLNLKDIGIPSKRFERWKYNDLKNDIRNIEFSLCKTSIKIKKNKLDKFEINEIDYFKKNKDHYLQPLKYLKDEGVVYLNLSYSNLFKVLTIKKDLKKPIIIDIQSEGHGMSFPRILININNNVNAEIQFLNRGGLGFINQITEINIGKNSNVKISRLNESSAIHSETFFSNLGRNSEINLKNLSIPNNKSRFQVFNSFKDEYSFAEFKSVSIPYENSKDDFLVHNNHLSSNCNSDVGMRSILGKGTECSFQALIDVENKIRNSRADQDCRAILLDEKASMNAKPEMKIYNNDVICKHGTTIGSLNQEQVFYLNSRGLNKFEAEKILLQGIISEYISKNSPLINFLPEKYK